jgi:putative transposase
MSFWRLYYHLVWATKNREPVITAAIEETLFPYLTRKAAELQVRIYGIDGWYDHVHVVAAIPPKIAVAEVVKTFKGASSHYLNQIVRLDFTFAWQRGYGALSIGERQLDIAIAYVNKQKEHHAGQNTNKWLEMMAESDEGPVEAIKRPTTTLRETPPVYAIGDDFPW